MARAPRADQLRSLLIRDHRTAKAKDQTSILATHFTKITIPKVVAGHMIVGNIYIEPLDSGHGEASLLDPGQKARSRPWSVWPAGPRPRPAWPAWPTGRPQVRAWAETVRRGARGKTRPRPQPARIGGRREP